MRVKRLTTWLVLGIALAYAARRRGRAVATRRRAVSDAPRVPLTPAQIDGTTLGRPDREGELFVEAISAWDLAPDPDLDVGVADPLASRVDLDPDTLSDDLGELAGAGAYGARQVHDSGDLYGVHVVPGMGTQLPDDDRTYDVGESWLEHLEHAAAELGPEPERVLDMADDSDHAPRGRRKSATGDTPVADHGSGGPRGL
ncbi:MAG TPA: hypothetical protein VNO30_33295 [Kofleriaceae bacterium]|nr:hypothetical protein [Kofleriaceae bacterium]